MSIAADDSLDAKLIAEIARILHEILGGSGAKINIDAHTDFRSIDLDSLDRINLLFSLEERFNIKISAEDQDKLFTVASIVEFIKANGKVEM